MIQRISKSVLAALVTGGAVAGCATTVDIGGPLLHYRYNYDSRPVVSESTVTVPAPVVTYREPGIVYRESEVTAYPESGSALHLPRAHGGLWISVPVGSLQGQRPMRFASPDRF